MAGAIGKHPVQMQVLGALVAGLVHWGNQ